MSSAIVPMPVTIEQVAAVVRNMSRAERQRLLELVPDLFEQSNRPRSAQALAEADGAVDQLRHELLAALNSRPLAQDDPFLDDMTVGEYLELSDAARAELWDRLTINKAVSWQEVDVHDDALPA